MAPFVSRLLSPPPSHEASTWSRPLLPRATMASPNPSPAGRRIAPPPASCPARRFPPSCASASDRGGASATAAGLDTAEEEEAEVDELPFFQLSSDILQTELSLLKADAPPAGGVGDSSLGITALENGDDEDVSLSGGREDAAYPAAMNAVELHLARRHRHAAPEPPPRRRPRLLLKARGVRGGPAGGGSRELAPSYPRVPITDGDPDGCAPGVGGDGHVRLHRPSNFICLSAAPAAVVRRAGGVHGRRPPLLRLPRRHRRARLRRPAGEGRPIALARANAALSRVDLLCETAGASIFAVLLARNDPVTCVRLSCAISLCSLPLLFFLGGAMNRLADGIFDRSAASASPAPLERSGRHGRSTAVGEAWETIRRGWTEYLRQPVLPASLAYVLVCFNVALAPGALMTTFLIHHGASASVLGAFGGSSAVVGILATFVTPYLVKELGILKAGAAGLVAQSALLGAAVVVFVTGPVSRRGALFAFLGFIVASRLGHMAYSVIGLQVVQTGNPVGKAKLIGATEIAVASLAELAMMAVAAVAGDAAHFGCLAALSAASVAAAAGLFCAWLANPTDNLRRLFPC
ncbi:solute carrier family 40 member 3, chloroplastic-like isoform X2 [Miscanthus floridulus]|uniref:solute carrier family 40 member 3, chloroplastic-like isoform X2 n=1 Tax=Miscanthus floridulus TaxID=154761 RepID=UPI003457E552